MMHKNISLIFAALFMLGSCGQKNEKLRETEGKTKKDVISFAPKVTGRILKIYVSEGQTVKKEILLHSSTFRKFLQK